MSSTRASRLRSARARGRAGTPGRRRACRARSARRSVPAAAVRRARRVDQRAPGRSRGRRPRVMRRPPRCRTASRQGDGAQPGRIEPLQQRAAAPRARPAGRLAVRAAWPSCSSRMSPAARPSRQALEHAAGLALHACRSRAASSSTSCSPRRCSTGASKRVAQPGRRAEEARPLAGDLGERVAAPGRSRRRGRAGRAARSGANARSLWFCTLWPRRAISRHSAGCARALLGDAEEGRARAVRVEQVEHRRRDLGVRAVVDRDRDLAARASHAGGSRSRLAPSQVERGHRPVAGQQRVVQRDRADGPGPQRRASPAAATPAPTCQATLAFSSSGGAPGAVATGRLRRVRRASTSRSG